MKGSGQESEDIMLCLVANSGHLYGLVISSLWVCFYICKIGKKATYAYSGWICTNQMRLYTKTFCSLFGAIKHKTHVDLFWVTHPAHSDSSFSESCLPIPQLDLLHHSTHLPTIDWTRIVQLILDGPIRLSWEFRIGTTVSNLQWLFEQKCKVWSNELVICCLLRAWRCRKQIILQGIITEDLPTEGFLLGGRLGKAQVAKFRGTVAENQPLLIRAQFLLWLSWLVNMTTGYNVVFETKILKCFFNHYKYILLLCFMLWHVEFRLYFYF